MKKKSTRANPTGIDKRLKTAMDKSNLAQSKKDTKVDQFGKKPSLVIAITTKKKK